MAFKNTCMRLLITVVLGGIVWYTVHIYLDIFNHLQSKPIIANEKKAIDNDLKLQLEDDPKEIKKADEEWEKQQSLFQPIVKKLNRNPCLPSSLCVENEFSFKLITGAANAIGPSVCFNGTVVMKNSLNNVDRGMNVAVVNGKTGESIRQLVFDLFEKDSTELKKFIQGLKDDEIILVATADDAAHKLDAEGKELLASIGSSRAKDLGFRDNWVFVGGKKIEHPSRFEKLIKNNKEHNKYGDWPEAITVEGCIPRLT